MYYKFNQVYSISIKAGFEGGLNLYDDLMKKIIAQIQDKDLIRKIGSTYNSDNQERFDTLTLEDTFRNAFSLLIVGYLFATFYFMIEITFFYLGYKYVQRRKKIVTRRSKQIILFKKVT